MLLYKNCLNRCNTYRITEIVFSHLTAVFPCFLSTYSVTKSISHCFACMSYFLLAGKKKAMFSWLLPLVPSKVILRVQCLPASEETSAVWWSHHKLKQKHFPKLKRLRKQSVMLTSFISAGENFDANEGTSKTQHINSFTAKQKRQVSLKTI